MSNKEVTELVRALRAQGWTVDETTKGYKAYPLDKAHKPVHFHKTPSDHRWKKNLVAELRRAGAKL